MLRIVLLSALAALGAAQQYNSDPKTAAILKEERYLSVDGKFGAAYQQEDGVQFKEESDADGTRRGSYSYVDPTGQRRTISYVAGKNGFVPTGDHIPAVPAPVVNPQPQYNSPPQPQARYNPQPQYNSPQPQYNSPQPQYNSPQPQYNNPEDDGQWVDDTKQDYPSNSPSNWNANPAPANWASNTAPQTFNSAPQQTWNTPAPVFNPAPTPAPVYNPQPAPVYTQAPPQRWNTPVETTPAPHRFFPPGKLNLQRSPDGFSFSFNKA